ncbi:molybdopterin-guanine dinucleotide biosynthesis protein B [Candidatus Bathyarchaeota archaeon]|nr:molybdopterin-guanine dinucleotide biosynthesis protein B [Candidatus Bathyarchaeota archaeon]
MSRLKQPRIAVIGYKNSGKTTVVENLVKALANKGFKVATVKHISEKNFSIDKEGSDTWRHSNSGAKLVAAVAEAETTLIIKSEFKDFNAEKFITPLDDFDVLIFEGFKNLLVDEEVAKIICVRSRDELKRFSKEAKGYIIGFCSFNSIEEALKLLIDLPKLIELTLKFINFERKILDLTWKLPQLDCKKCGYYSCRELALKIYEGKASFNDCKVLESKNLIKTKLIVDNNEVPIQRFVAEMIRLTVLGMASALKGVSINGDEKVFIEVKKE